MAWFILILMTSSCVSGLNIIMKDINHFVIDSEIQEYFYIDNALKAVKKIEQEQIQLYQEKLKREMDALKHIIHELTIEYDKVGAVIDSFKNITRSSGAGEEKINPYTSWLHQHGRKLTVGHSYDKVAFHAILDSRLKTQHSGDIVKFDRIITNIGSDYNPYTGEFTCRVPGTYVFFHDPQVSEDEHIYTNIAKNGVVESSARGWWESSFVARVLVLNTGDTVWVSPQKQTLGVTQPRQGSSTFSGFLLYNA